MAAQVQYQTPGVYVVEQDGFSSSVVEVPTAVPVFIGYTQIALRGKQDLTGKAIALTSMIDFMKLYCDPKTPANGAPSPKFGYNSPSTAAMPPCPFDPANPRFNLYYAMQLFFMNGGGNCYVLSLGPYSSSFTSSDYTNIWLELEKHSEPTIVVMPDSVLLSANDWTTLSAAALQHCAKMQNRVVIFDLVKGYLPPDGSDDDPIKGSDNSSGFYASGTDGEDFNKYGIAYYPWINTTVVPASNVDFSLLTDDAIGKLQTDLTTEATDTLQMSAAKLADYAKLVTALASKPAGKDLTKLHQQMQTLSPLYRQLMKDLATSINMLPPGGAMAGVFALNDTTFGVWQSPANTGIAGAISAAVNLSDNDQDELNVPLNGLAVNAIRTFPNFGLLVWGARTMAGNSDDWRYVSVRRTVIMLEQSIKFAMHPFVFKANVDLTWTAIHSTIDNFLNSMWMAGALQGAKAADAYSIAVGLGKTMTAEDIEQGYMRVTVKIAVTHPAEFIVLTFVQQAAVS
jgi:phage tail sheath protein FI